MFDGQFPKAAALVLTTKIDVLTFVRFPRALWRKIWSNNPLERLNERIKRRTNVVGSLPNDVAVVRHHRKMGSATHLDPVRSACGQ